MKFLTRYFLFCLFIITCQYLSAQDTTINNYKSPIQNKLSGWVKSFTNFDLSSFKKEGVSAFEQIEYMDMEDTTDFYAIYKPALGFSPDKTQFIDIYSYWLALDREGKKIISRGGEAEQAITWCNFKTKKWLRIFFRGTTERIQDVIWLTNSTFILVGVTEDDVSKQHPVIYFADTKSKTFLSFMSVNKKTIQKKTGYVSPKLLKLKIIEK